MRRLGTFESPGFRSLEIDAVDVETPVFYRKSTISDVIGHWLQESGMAKSKTKKKRCDSTPVELKADPTADDFAKLAWAMAHPARVQIVRLLIGREACMCGEIVDCLPLAQSTVSQHLKILKESAGSA